MKIFQNKKIWQKLVIILLLILLFKFAINIPNVYAADDGVLLEPITNLFANLGDGIMEIMQKTFLGVETSGGWVEAADNGLWAKILVIGIAILAATVAIVATIVSGGSALVIVASLIGALIKIGIGTTIAYFAVSTLKFGDKGFYLPEYDLTLQSILSNEILAFDVNFFNPKPPIERKTDPNKEINLSYTVATGTRNATATSPRRIN